MKRIILLISAVLLAIPLFACGVNRTVTTSIRHPMHTGSVDENLVPIQYTALERRRGLPPNSLDDIASLTRLDTSGLCFDVTLRSIDTMSPPSFYDFEVALDIGEDLRIVQPDFTLGEPQVIQHNGLNQVRVQRGYEDVCTERNSRDECLGWERRPRYVNEMQPGIVNVAEGGGTLCFANDGYVTPATPMVALVLKRGGQTLRFEWELQSMVQEQPAQ